MQNNDNQTAQNSINNRGETNRKDLENEIRSTWLGRQGSNLRMTVPKTVALPLGHAPMSMYFTLAILAYATDQDKPWAIVFMAL
jgi:hypothetical protein